jgi:plasmid stabilization system protein ParE
MLADHARFLARVSEKAAMRLVSEVERKAGLLEKNPEGYPWLSDPLLPEHKYRKLLFEKRYLIVYQVEENSVFVDAVVDCRQDYAWLL